MGLRVGGLASGLDTNSIVSALMQLERRPLTLIQQQKKDVENKQSLFEALRSKLEALRNAAAAIDNWSSTLAAPAASEEFLAWKAASSDEGVLTARVTGTATPDSTAVRVVALATSARRVSGAFASDTDPVAVEGDTLVIEHGGAAPISLTVAAGGASLRDLASLINADANNGGAVRADVVYDGSGYRLLVLGTESGAAEDVTLTSSIAGPGGGAFLDAAAGQSASDATLEVFGLTVTRTSNTVSDLIPGVTLELHAASASAVEVQVERDDAAIGDKLQALADAYNDVVEFIDAQSRFDAQTERAGPLSGDGALRGVQMRIQRLASVGVSIPGNAFTSLAGFGVSLDDDGRLALDRDALANALAADPQAVRQVLSGDGTTDGIALAFVRAIDPLIEEGSGMLAVRNDALDARLEGLDRAIERLEQRLERREELLVAQFTRLESAIATLQAQGSALAGLSVERSK
jgi:flagellar hook-associated protein 2